MAEYDCWVHFQSELPPDWTYLLSKDRRANHGSKKYNACSTFKRMLMNIDDQDSAYEIIADKDTRVWLYFDCDGPDSQYGNAEVLRAARKAIETRMAAEGIPPSKLYVSTSTTPSKLSLHLKYRVLFMDLWALEAFAKRVIQDVVSAGTPELMYATDKGMKCVVDASVYSNFRSYRCLGMTKLGKQAPLIAVDNETGTIPAPDDTFVDHLVKFYDEAGQNPDHVVPAQGEPATVTNKPRKDSSIATVITKAPVTEPDAVDDESQFALCQKYSEYLNRYDALVQILQDKIVVGRVSIKTPGVYVCSIKKNCKHVCPYAHRKHDSNNLFVVHNEHKRKLTLRCHDEDCFHRKDVSFVIWDTSACDTDMWDKVDFSSMHSQHENIAWAEVYNEPLMRDYPLRPLVCVRAGMGVGKTRALLRLAETFENKTKALIVTYSQALATKLSKEFRPYGFVNYKASEGQIVDAKVVVCLDSLYRVATSQFDYVFLDEAVSLFLHLNSPLMGAKTSINLSLLELAVIQGSYVYFLDACMDHTFGKNVVDFFAGQKKCVPHWIHNTFVRKSDRHMLVDVVPMAGANVVTKSSQISRAVGKVLDLLKAGKNVVVCSSSKSFTVRLQNFIRESRPATAMLVYNSDTSERLDDVASLWKTCQLLVYSPSITAGVSFEEDHFDSLVAFVSNGRFAPTVDMTLQQLFRVRNLASGAMHLYIHESDETSDEVEFPQTMDGVTKFLQADITLTSKYFALYKVNIPGVYRPSADHVLEYDTQRLSFVVIQGIVMMRNRSTMHYSKIMVDTLHNDYNIRLENVSTPECELSQVDIDMLKAAPSKAEPVPWENILPFIAEDTTVANETVCADRRVSAALKSLLEFKDKRWKTRDLTLQELEAFYHSVQNEESAVEAYHRASRFVTAMDRTLEANTATFAECVNATLCQDDHNMELFKGRKVAYAMKVVIGQRFLNSIVDSASMVALGSYQTVSVQEDACMKAYKDIVESLSPQEMAKLSRLFAFKGTTGCVVAKKILGDCFGMEAVRRDPKSDRRHYHTIVLSQPTLKLMSETFGADLHRPLGQGRSLFKARLP